MTDSILLERQDTGELLAVQIQPPTTGWTPTPPHHRTDDPWIRARFDDLFERLDELSAWIDGEAYVARAEMILLCDREGVPPVFAELPPLPMRHDPYRDITWAYLPPDPTEQLRPDRLDAEFDRGGGPSDG